MTTTETQLLTADDLLRLDSEGVRGELVRGLLHEPMPAGERHGNIAANLVYLLGAFVKPRGLGSLAASDSGVWLERDPDTVREPDIAFTSFERRSRGTGLVGYAETVPDLVVEVISPSAKADEPAARAQMWLSFGVRLVWIVFPETRSVDMHRADQPVVSVSDEESLGGLDVLPGFSCALAEIFDE
jgi:Uma2 family endonuclease